ncbi:hypothetical protein Tco_0133799 [Tanacetum coccineum]
MMTDKYCPQNEIKKLEMEIWDMKVKGTDLTSYTQRFFRTCIMCGRMFPEEFDKIEKYVGGLPDMIHGSVIASKPKTMQDAIEIATELIDKKISTLAERQAENKRKLVGLDVVHPVPVTADVFPAVTIVVILASHGEAIRGIHEYLTMEAIETVTRSQERRARREMEQ